MGSHSARPTPNGERAGSARPVIIGTGRIASMHVKALLGIGIQPVAAWGPSIQGRERFADQWSLKTGETLDSVLDTSAGTHVHICSPPMHRVDAVRAAAVRGMTVISEKPLAATGDLASEAYAETIAHGVPAWVNFNRRMEGGVQLMRAALADGAIGEPVSAFGHYRQQWDATPSGLDWRYDATQVGPGRTTTEIGSHWLDLAEFVLGRRIVETSAFAVGMGERKYEIADGTGTIDPPNDDLFAALLRFERGPVGQVYGTELAHGSFDEIELRIDGTRGSAIWTSDHPNLLRIGDKRSGMRIVGNDAPTSSLVDSIAAVYDGTAAQRGVATFEQGVHNSLTLDALHRSIASRVWEGVDSATTVSHDATPLLEGEGE